MKKKKRIELYLEFERPMGEAERAPLRDLVRRRASGVPLQHLLGTVEFLGREFRSDPRALIPRPETEQLVEAILTEIPPDSSAAVLDVGTGSGVIAISLALARPQLRVTGCDVSEEALALAAENRASHALTERLALVRSDLLASAPGPWDVIVANLPYVTAAEMTTLQPEVRHDPALALDGGEDGLDLIRRLIRDAREHLAPGGLLALEAGHSHAPAIATELAQHNYRDIRTLSDYQDIPRFTLARSNG
jgi:release factor glutamine methyltransferase